MIPGLLAFSMVVPAVAAEVVFTHSSVRIRERPSTGSATVRLVPMGTELEVTDARGSWVGVHGGWVHGSLVGPTWWPPPAEDAPVGVRGRIVARRGDVLFEVIGENDGVALCGVLLRERTLGPCVRDRVDTAEALWDRRGRAVQGLLADSRAVRVEPVDPLAVGEATWIHLVTPTGPVRSPSSLRVGEREVWSASLQFARAELRGLLLDRSWLLVCSVERPLSGGPSVVSSGVPVVVPTAGLPALGLPRTTVADRGRVERRPVDAGCATGAVIGVP